MMNFITALAKAAAVGEGSPLSSAVPGSNPKPTTPKAPAPRTAPPAMGSSPGSPNRLAAVPSPPVTPAPAVAPAPRPVAPSASPSNTGATPTLAPAAPKPAPVSPPPATLPPPVSGNEQQPNEQTYKALESMAPMMMGTMGKGFGQVGGMPLLMMLWDMIGGQRGQNVQKIFGDLQPGQLGKSLSLPSASTPAPSSTVPTEPAPEAPVSTVSALPQSGSIAMPGGDAVSGVAAPTNAAQNYRKWLKETTDTGPTMIGKTPVNLGNMGADLGGGLATNYYANKGIKAMTGKAPGFTPLNVGLDGLDLLGWNPTSDRFGEGAMSPDEARQRGEALAGAPGWLRGLHGFTSPLSTMYQAGALTNAARNDVVDANASAAKTMNMQRGPDGEPVLQAGVPAQGDGSWVGNATSNALQRMDEWQRRKAWREWSAGREQQLMGVTDPSQKAKAEWELSNLRQRRVETKPGIGENLYNNASGDVATLGQLFRGEAHMPWSEDTSSADLATQIKQQERQEQEAHQRNQAEYLRLHPGATTMQRGG